MKRLLPIVLLVFSIGIGAETIDYPNGTYVGQVSNGSPHGQGTIIQIDGHKYVGEWKNGKRHGQGTYTWPSGNKYVGEYKDDRRWKGTIYDKDGNVIATIGDGVRRS